MIGTTSAPTTTDRVPATSAAPNRRTFDMCQVSREAYVAQIKALVESGEYRPNLEVVAERLLTDLATPYER